jgi:hypothetical protein
MSRHAVTGLLLGILLGLPALVRAQDVVEYNNRAEKKPKDIIKGSVVEESVQGIKVKPSGKPAQLIPAADIISVSYDPPTTLTAVEMRGPMHKEESIKQAKPGERASRIDEAIKAYKEIIPKLDAAKNAQAYLEYRLAQMLVGLWDDEPVPSRAKDAIEALTRWKDDHPNSWEYVRCMQTLSRLQDAQQDRDGARKTYEEIAQRTELPADIRAGADFSLVRMSLRSPQGVPQAEARLQELAKLIAKDDPRLLAYQIECQIKKGDAANAEKQLKTILAGPADDAAKAIAANVLGDYYYQIAKKPEDALWQYLWVDVLYNKDPDEHARALYQLSKLFKEVKGDEARAQMCRKKLDAPEFAGIEYQRQAKAEDKPK